MTKKELKQEAKEYAHNNYEILVDTSNAFVTSEDYLEQGYITGAEPREKRIADLEQKLEQTEKDLTDYQFNYPKIKDLEKENAELKEALAEQKQYNAFKCEDNKKTIDNLKQENAELQETLKTYNGCGDWDNDFHTCRVYLQHEELEMYIHQLREAKELLAKWVELYKPKLEDFPKPPIQVDTEQFLSEVEK